MSNYSRPIFDNDTVEFKSGDAYVRPDFNSADADWAEHISSGVSLEAIWGGSEIARGSCESSWISFIHGSVGLVWGDVPQASKSVESSWSSLPTPKKDHLSAWAGCAPSGLVASFLWGQSPLIRSRLESGWSNVPAPISSLNASWGTTGIVGSALALYWGEPDAINSSLDVGWGDSIGLRSSLSAGWGEFGLVGSTMSSHWGVSSAANCTVIFRWGDSSHVASSLEGLWDDGTVPRSHMGSSWGDSESVKLSHLSPWESSPSVLRHIEALWGDSGSVGSTLEAYWSDSPMVAPSHVVGWGEASVLESSLGTGWGTGSVLKNRSVIVWGEQSPPKTALESRWSDSDFSRASVSTRWGDSGGARSFVDSVWGSSAISFTDHVSQWGEAGELRSGHALSWGTSEAVLNHHMARWGESSYASSDLWSWWGTGDVIKGSIDIRWAESTTVESAILVKWGEVGELKADHSIAWGVRPSSIGLIISQWGDSLVARSSVQSNWDSPEYKARYNHGSLWSEWSASRSYSETLWGDSSVHRASHVGSWGDLLSVGRGISYKWVLSTPVRSELSTGWSIKSMDPLGSSMRTPWTLLSDVSTVSVANTPTLKWNGLTTEIFEATLSADEDSPVWMAESIVLSDYDFWVQIALGDDITLVFGEEEWNLRVDGKPFTRVFGKQDFSLSAVSPMAWLDAPYHSLITIENETPISAKEVVTALVSEVGVLEWELDDWVIPAGALSMSETTPLIAARAIVGAIGGLLESTPSGTPIARKRFPVPVPEYGPEMVDHEFFESQVFGASTKADPYSGFNRVIISNEDLESSSNQDRLSYIAGDTNYEGTVKAWPYPVRMAELGHTGDEATKITSLGTKVETHRELVEFIEGSGSVQHPISTIVSVVWQHVDLGSLEFDRMQLTASVAEQSLAWVTYQTTSLDWDVGLEKDEAVQFVLI